MDFELHGKLDGLRFPFSGWIFRVCFHGFFIGFHVFSMIVVGFPLLMGFHVFFDGFPCVCFHGLFII